MNYPKGKKNLQYNLLANLKNNHFFTSNRNRCHESKVYTLLFAFSFLIFSQVYLFLPFIHVLRQLRSKQFLQFLVVMNGLCLNRTCGLLFELCVIS